MIRVSEAATNLTAYDVKPGKLYQIASITHSKFKGAVLLAIEPSAPMHLRPPRPRGHFVWLNRAGGPIRLSLVGDPEVLYSEFIGQVLIEND